MEPQPAELKSVIYILGAEQLQAVKIGFSESTDGMRQRLAAAQTYCPAELNLLAAFPGTLQDERSIHSHFSQHRLKGEWFVWTEAVDSFVKKCQSAHGSSGWIRYAFDASELGGEQRDWNPARWVQIVAARGAKLIPLRVLLRRKGSQNLLMYYRHPVYPHREITKSSGTRDGREAAAAAVVWENELQSEWRAKGIQLPPARRRLPRSPREVIVSDKEHRTLKRKYRELYAAHQHLLAGEKTSPSEPIADPASPYA